jgi:heat shock protein HslJ/uncharacterized lipoprotein NlpE involved in copper resistance
MMVQAVRRFLACLAATLALASCHASDGAARTGEPQLVLPASFTGTLPCGRSHGMRAHLDLWPDGTFHLGREASDEPGCEDDVGRWRRDAGSAVILLYGGREMPLQLEIVGPRILRALDIDGRPAGQGSAHDLVSDGRLEPTDVQRPLHGMFRYMADAPTFAECLTGRSYPVAMEADYLALERAYLGLRTTEPGAAVLASFDGEIAQRPPMEGDGTVPTVVVKRYVGLWPGQSCERAMSHASLSQQYWRVVSLRGAAAGPVDASREPQLILRGTEHGYSADAGCGRLAGEYRVEGTGIRFQAPVIIPACPAALREQQAALLGVLEDARAWRIQGQVLELFDAPGQPLAVLEAVYLR